MFKKFAFVPLLGMFISSPSVADNNFEDNRHYLGLGAGFSDISLPTNGSNWQLTDHYSSSVKVIFGHHITPQWLLEFSYTNIGEGTLKNKNTAETTRFDIKGLQCMGGYRRSLGEWFPAASNIDLVLKAGVTHYQTDINRASLELSDNHRADLAWAGGVQWNFSPKWHLYSGIESYSDNALSVALSISRSFGKASHR